MYYQEPLHPLTLVAPFLIAAHNHALPQAFREEQARALAGPIMDGPRQRNRVNYAVGGDDRKVTKGGKGGKGKGRGSDGDDSDFGGKGTGSSSSSDEDEEGAAGSTKKEGRRAEKAAKREKKEKVWATGGGRWWGLDVAQASPNTCKTCAPFCPALQPPLVR